MRFSRRSEIGASVPFVAHRQNRRSRAFNVGDFADAICKNALAAVGMGPYARVDDSWRHSEKKNKRMRACFANTEYASRASRPCDV